MKIYLGKSKVRFIGVDFQLINLRKYKNYNLIKLERLKSRGNTSEENN